MHTPIDTNHCMQVASVPAAKGMPQFALYHDTPQRAQSSTDTPPNNIKSSILESELLQTDAQANFLLGGELSKKVTMHDEAATIDQDFQYGHPFLQ